MSLKQVLLLLIVSAGLCVLVAGVAGSAWILPLVRTPDTIVLINASDRRMDEVVLRAASNVSFGSIGPGERVSRRLSWRDVDRTPTVLHYRDAAGRIVEVRPALQADDDAAMGEKSMYLTASNGKARITMSAED